MAKDYPTMENRSSTDQRDAAGTTVYRGFNVSAKSMSLVWLAIWCGGLGCATSRSVNGPGEFGFLAKGGSCQQLAQDAGTVAAVAFTLHHRPPPADVQPIEPWRMLAFATHQPLEARGWSQDEIFTFARDMMDASSQVDKITGILTADLYYETACELLRQNQPVQAYSHVATKVASCLHREDRRDGIQCTSGVIR